MTLAAAPEGELLLSRDEWALLSLVDGARTVADLVSLSGTGEYVVVSVLAGLAQRGLVTVGRPTAGTAVAQRQQLLAALEGRPAPAMPAGWPRSRDVASRSRGSRSPSPSQLPSCPSRSSAPPSSRSVPSRSPRSAGRSTPRSPCPP